MSGSIKRNTIYNAIKTCSTILFPLITIPYVNRVLLPANVGKVDFARSFISYFSLIATLGITTYAIRECAAARNDEKQLDDISSQLFSMNIITTAIAYALLVLVMLGTRRFDEYGELIAIQSATLFFAAIGADWLNSAMEDFKFITLRTIAFQIVSLVLMFVFIHEQSDYVKYSLITVISASGASIANVRYRHRYCKMRFTLNIDWRRHLAPVVFLFVMTLSQVVFSNADITMLGIMRSDFEVGLYSTAHKITGMISTVVSSVGIVVMPRLSYYFAKDDYEQANVLLRKLLGLNVGVGLPCFAGVIMLADDISWLVGGEQFSAAASIMRILILAFLFSLVGGSFLGNAILITTKQEKYYMVVCCITAGVNVVVNALLIPSMGANGAAIATALNGLIILVLLLLRVDKRIKINGMKDVFFGPVVGCLGIVMCCLVCAPIDNIYVRTLGSVVLSVATYATILLALKNEFAHELFATISSRLRRGKATGE